ncbi:hypothetical protein [Flavobacterium sp. 5]|uniref:hypothetical protein n=1 Tax=Flavobacterium sp. 5 TaxID=2035199 RepID=UPI0018E28DF8|nr:hypothetical protein [Flavobacterium sp. 5]
MSLTTPVAGGITLALLGLVFVEIAFVTAVLVTVGFTTAVGFIVVDLAATGLAVVVLGALGFGVGFEITVFATSEFSLFGDSRGVVFSGVTFSSFFSIIIVLLMSSFYCS